MDESMSELNGLNKEMSDVMEGCILNEEIAFKNQELHFDDEEYFSHESKKKSVFNFENFIGVKKLKAALTTKAKYCEYRGWDVPDNEDGSEEVYILEYPEDINSKMNHSDHKGYISMSSKLVFEKHYRSGNNLSLGMAIEMLNIGECISTPELHKEGKFICKQIPSIIPESILQKMNSLPIRAKKLLTQKFKKRKEELDESLEPVMHYDNQLIIVSEDLSITYWIPNSEDFFREDYFVLK